MRRAAFLVSLAITCAGLFEIQGAAAGNAGAFNPEAETASGRGSFAVFNGYDDVDASLGGPTFRGTWQVTDFVGWTPDGELQVLVTFFITVGLDEDIIKPFPFPIEGVTLTISEEGINVDLLGLEQFATNMTGSARFHIKKP